MEPQISWVSFPLEPSTLGRGCAPVLTCDRAKTGATLGGLPRPQSVNLPQGNGPYGLFPSSGLEFSVDSPSL